MHGAGEQQGLWSPILVNGRQRLGHQPLHAAQGMTQY